MIIEMKKLSLRIWRVYWTLLKIMVPVLIIVKVLDLLGASHYLSFILSPLMEIVGLPKEMGIVWAAAILVNIYTSMAVFFSIALLEPLTVAQMTVLATMILIAHGLPMESAISKAAGIGWIYTISLRLQSWLIVQLQTLAFAFVMIASLVVIMRLLDYFGIEKLLHWLLTPFLKLLGIGKEAANITIIGMILGLSFGGALLIEQAKSGQVSKRNIFLAMSLLCLCHSIIEDTLLMVLLGADLLGILWARMIFSFLFVIALARVYFLIDKDKPSIQ